MLKLKRLYNIVVLCLPIFSFACSASATVDLNLVEPNIASEPPDGSDLLSSSTNFSDKIFDPGEKADPLSGADFIAPPSVSNYGAVSFRYKLELPQGRAGVMPQISLSYSSSGADGWLGVGWSLGMSAISRTTKNGELYYDGRDTFTWGGKRLVKVSGPSGSEDGEYRPEIENGSFTRLTLTDSANGGIWTVEDSNGRKTFYGATRDERIYRPDNVNKTYAWQFSKAVDKNGNYMYAVYDNSQYNNNHILYLKEIRYTGNEDTSETPKLYVKFHLKGRNDFYVSKTPGFIVKMDKVIDRIEMGKEGIFGDTTLWDYQMEYTQSPDSSRPLLITIHSSKNTTTPVFHYQPAVNNFIWQNYNNLFVSDPETNPDLTKYFEGDVDGDGISDMIFFNPQTGDWKVVESDHTGIRVYKTYGNKFAGYDTEEEIQWFKGNVTGDYDGNGKSDIAFYLPKTKEFWVAQSQGDHFTFKMYGKLTISDVDIFTAEWFTGDYDGNGISDIVFFDERSGSWIFMTNTGGAFSFIKFGQNFQNLYRDDYNPALAMNSKNTGDLSEEGRARNKITWMRGDYNGDGRSDIALYDARDGKWWVAQNVRDDVLGFRLEWKLYQVFNAPARALFSNRQFSGDFNADGYSDFLIFDRDTNQWVIGEVSDDIFGNPTVNFKVWSGIPELKNITKWLQGDFNGDGRTDIGFYSASDNNFWIGESKPNGFRYRIYSNISFGGPDPVKIMAAPTPEEEVRIKRREATLVQGGVTKRITYEYNANSDQSHGEVVFIGDFTGISGSNPEFLIYDKFTKTFSIKQGNGILAPTNISFDSSISPNRFITATKPFRNTVSGLDEVIVYEFNPGANLHTFSRIFYNGTFQKKAIATIPGQGGSITDFDINSSLYLINDYKRGASDGAPQILILDDQNTGNLYYYHNDVEISLTVSGSAQLPSLAGIFGDADRWFRSAWTFFSGDFDGVSSSVELLFVDESKGTPKWYSAGINFGSSSVAITELGGTFSLLSVSFFEELHRTLDLSGAGLGADELLFYSISNGSVFLKRLQVIAGNAVQTTYSPLPQGVNFRWEINHQKKPIVYTPTGPQFLVFSGTSYSLEIQDLNNGNYPVFQAPRPDLYTKVYPFRWIQGDYNGDSKTDIGIFHLKETKWYFAMTQGTAPDLIQQVDNGIGGSYQFEYANSTSFDNTGVDNIPDLGINYKVCVKQTINDGLGKSVYNTYEYKDGFAWTAYLNGKKEVDVFGFSTFTKTDPLGSKTIRTYYTTPYANFLLNRALGGALKEERFIGYDSKEYVKTQTDYLVHEIVPTPGISSYLVYPSEKRTYKQGFLTTTETKNINFSLSEYRLLQLTGTSIDHYTDSAHSSSALTSIINFEYIISTNEQRPTSQVRNAGTPFEITITFTYDINGNPIEQRVSNTGTGLPVVNDKIVKTEFDTYGNKTAEEDSSQTPVMRVETQYDSTYHQFPVLTRRIGPINLDSTVSFSFDGASFGQALQQTDPNGNSTYIEYDNYGRVIRIKADTDNGLQTLSEYIYSLPAAFFGAGEFPLSAKTIHYTGGSYNIQSRVWKDGFGRYIQTVQSALDGVSGKQFIKTGLSVYDALGRVIRQSQTHWAADNEIDTYLPNAVEKNPTITVYDPSGRIKKVILPPAYAGEPETSVTNTYNDPYETTVTHSDGQYKTVVKDGREHLLYLTEGNINNSSITAKMGFCYDGVNQGPIYRQDLNGASMNCPAEFSIQTVPTARDSSGNNVNYTLYDAYGQIRQANDPDFGKMILEYDAFGQVVFKQDAKGQTTQIQYDRLGRMTQKILPDGSTVTYQYDSLSGSQNAKGELVRITDKNSRKSFSYSKRGFRKQEIRELVSVTADTTGYESSVTTNYAYDFVGRTKSITYPTDEITGRQATVCYDYNSFGLASNVDISFSNDCASIDKSIITNMEYDEFGYVTKLDLGNGVSTTYTYDVRGRATNMVSTATVNGKTVKHQDVKYTYNINNSIASVVNNPTAEDISGSIVPAFESRYEYTYDGLNRLVEAKGSYGQSGFVNSDPVDTGNQKYHRSYAYAKNGNLTQKNILDPETQSVTDAWNYTYENHRVTSVTSSAYGAQKFSFNYDANGNTISKNDAQKGLTKTLTYDYANRIVRVKDQTGKTMGEYGYDDQGARVRKIVDKDMGGETRTLVLSLHSKYFATERQITTVGGKLWNVPGTAAAINNIYLNGVRIASMDSNGNAAYYLANHVNSVKIVTDEFGAAVARTEYLPYGETFAQEGDKVRMAKYNGQALDKETDLYFYNARHYDPEIARFVTPDTKIPDISNTVDWNRFAYTRNNPIKYTDPSGHNPVMTEAAKKLGIITLAVLKAAMGEIFKQYSEKYMYHKKSGRDRWWIEHYKKENNLTEEEAVRKYHWHLIQYLDWERVAEVAIEAGVVAMVDNGMGLTEDVENAIRTMTVWALAVGAEQMYFHGATMMEAGQVISEKWMEQFNNRFVQSLATTGRARPRKEIPATYTYMDKLVSGMIASSKIDMRKMANIYELEKQGATQGPFEEDSSSDSSFGEDVIDAFGALGDWIWGERGYDGDLGDCAGANYKDC